MMKRKKYCLNAVLIIVIFLTPVSCWAEIIQPLFNEKEVRSVLDGLHKNGLKIFNLDKDIRGKSITIFYSETATFDLKDISFGSYQFYKTDINNDGGDEYLLVGWGGSGQFFDIEGVYKTVNGKWHDIYPGVKGNVGKAIWGQNYEPNENGDVGLMHGGIIVEKENNQIYFSLAEANGRWWEVDDNGGKWVEEHNPMTYKFLWQGQEVKLIGKLKREFTRELNPYAKQLVESDPIFLKEKAQRK